MTQQIEITSYEDVSTNTNIPNIVFRKNTLWMTQEQMWILYWKVNSTISEHIKKIYKDWELQEASTSEDDRIFGNSENRIEKSSNMPKKPKKYYNLQIVIAVWFRVNSPKAINFRTWANNIIEQYIGKWYVLDDDRLKWWKTFWWKRDYENLMDRVRTIRFDERNIYEKIKDLFTTAVDYDTCSQEAIEFFQTIQNKFHYAIVWMTSPEISIKNVYNTIPIFYVHYNENYCNF